MKGGLLLDRASRSVKPRGARPPRPNPVRTVLRIVLGLSVVLSIVPRVTEWALGGRHPAADTPADVVLRVGDALADRNVDGVVAACAALLTAVLLAEIVLQLWVRRCHQHAILVAAGEASLRQLYLVRVPRQTTTGAGMRAQDPSGDLFRALTAAVPTRAQRWGRAPYVAFTLIGEPDQATALHYLVAGGTPAQRDQLADTLAATVTAQHVQAAVDVVDDPVAAAAHAPGTRWIAWQTYRLALPPHYPIRLPEDTDQTDLLASVVRALEPCADEHILELQIILQPIRGVLASFLHRGWRGHATALRLQLQNKEDYALSNDIRALETKLAGVPFYVTVRALAVVGSEGTGNIALERITNALGVYESRTSHLTQKWVGEGVHCVALDTEAPIHESAVVST